MNISFQIIFLLVLFPVSLIQGAQKWDGLTSIEYQEFEAAAPSFSKIALLDNYYFLIENGDVIAEDRELHRNPVANEGKDKAEKRILDGIVQVRWDPKNKSTRQHIAETRKKFWSIYMDKNTKGILKSPSHLTQYIQYTQDHQGHFYKWNGYVVIENSVELTTGDRVKILSGYRWPKMDNWWSWEKINNEGDSIYFFKNVARDEKEKLIKATLPGMYTERSKRVRSFLKKWIAEVPQLLMFEPIAAIGQQIDSHESGDR